MSVTTAQFLLCISLTLTVAGCTAKPEVVYSSDSRLSHLKVSSDIPYIEEGSLGSPATFVRINQNGTATEIVRSSENLGEGPIADGRDLYWFDFDKNICTKPIDATANVTATCAALGSVEQRNPLPREYMQMTGKELQDLIAGKGSGSTIMELAGTPSAMYWVDMHSPDQDGLLMSGSAKGAKPQLIAHGHLLRAVATDADTLFWVVSVQNGDEIHSKRTNGSSKETVWKGLVRSNLASDGTYLYFSTLERATKLNKSDQTVSPVDTGSPVDKYDPAVLAIDQANVYIGYTSNDHPGENYSGNSMIFRIPKSGGKRAKLASLRGAVSDLVANSGELYWISCTGFNGPCQVMKTATK